MQMRTTLFFLLVALSLSGCTQPENSRSEEEYQAYVQKLIPPGKDAAARRFIECIRSGDTLHAEQMAGPPLQGADAVNMFRQLHDLINQGDLREIAPIGFDKGNSTYAQRLIDWDALSYQLHFKERWYVAKVVLDSSPDSDAIVGVRITYFNGFESSAAFNRFTLTGRTWRDWTALILCIVTPVFIISTIVICVLSPISRKWLWILFILIGIVQFRYDWTHALVEVQPVSLLLLGSGYQRANIYSPLILQWAIPVGAFIFLIYRRKLIEARIPEAQKPTKRQSSGLSS